MIIFLNRSNHFNKKSKLSQILQHFLNSTPLVQGLIRLVTKKNSYAHNSATTTIIYIYRNSNVNNVIRTDFTLQIQWKHDSYGECIPHVHCKWAKKIIYMDECRPRRVVPVQIRAPSGHARCFIGFRFLYGFFDFTISTTFVYFFGIN